MPFLACCIVPAGHEPPPGLVGAGGHPVLVETAGALACWVTEVAARPAVTADAVRAHNDVIAAAMTEVVTPVPLRFGQAFESRAVAAAAIAAEEDRWLALLRRFAGRAEYGVRVIAEAPSGEAGGDRARDVHGRTTGSGAAYMAALAAREAERNRRKEAGDELARRVLERAGSVIADARHEPLESEHGLVSMAHLVAWSDIDGYHASLRAVRDESDDLRFLFTGPWPPYSFVE